MISCMPIQLQNLASPSPPRNPQNHTLKFTTPPQIKIPTFMSLNEHPLPIMNLLTTNMTAGDQKCRGQQKSEYT